MKTPTKLPLALLAVPLLTGSLLAQEAKDKNAAEPAVADGPAPGHSHAGAAFDEGPRQAGRKMDGTGKVHFPITTSWTRGQVMFDQGIGQLHGFWYYEAERTFRQIAAEDPDCAMAYWGMAMANWENSKRAKGFMEKAVERRDKATPREQLYIDAQVAVMADEPTDIKQRRQKLIENYENIIHEYPDDIEAKAFLAVRLWQFSRQGIPIPSRQAVDSLLDQVFASSPMHPAHHYRIHLWDSKKPTRALASSAVLHATAPTIAHMWHMPGHIYSKLKRYQESAYHQEASARVDHRTQAENGVMPDTIHNYAHNNEWLVRNWNHVGRADDAVAMAKGLIDNPMHPKLNHYGKGGSSASYGRRRLIETLERFERWDELVALADTYYLEPTDGEKEQIARLNALARARFAQGDKAALFALRDELVERAKKVEGEKAGKLEEVKVKAEKDKKNKKDTDKLVKDAAKGFDTKLKNLRPARDETLVYAELLNGEKLDDARANKIKRQKAALALLHLGYGEAEKAKSLAAEAVKEGEKRTVPLAVQAYVLEQTGDHEGAAAAFKALKEMSGPLQIDAVPFARLAPLAKRLGEPDDWRVKQSWRGDDFGEGKPDRLDHLGPLVYQAPPAPDFDLRGEGGGRITLADFAGRPVLLIMYLGHSCEHCVEQLNAFAPLQDKFTDAGIEVIAVSPEKPVELAKAHDLCAGEEKQFPFPLYSDEGMRMFKTYRAYDDFENDTLHGTFLVDPAGKLRWMDVGPEPFMEGEFLLEEAQRLLGM